MGKLNVSFLIECESPMVVQLIGGRTGIQNCLIPRPVPISWSPIWKEHKMAVLFPSLLFLVSPELWLIQLGFLN